MSRGEVSIHRDGRLSMEPLFTVVLSEPADELSDKEDKEHRHQQQRQPAISDPLHSELLGGIAARVSITRAADRFLRSTPPARLPDPSGAG